MFIPLCNANIALRMILIMEWTSYFCKYFNLWQEVIKVFLPVACMVDVEYARSKDFLIKLNYLIHPFHGTLHRWALHKNLSSEQRKYGNM